VIAWWCCGTLCGAGVALGVVPSFGSRVFTMFRRVRSSVEGRVGRLTLHTSEADLAICERHVNELVTHKLLYSILGGITGAVASATFSVSASSAPSAAIPIGLICAAVGFVIPDASLRAEAKRRRRDFVHSFSGFLDLVNVLLAGGAGLETALIAAAEAGDGPAFVRLRTALLRSRTVHRSPWDELHDMGVRLGLDQVVEVAGSLQLAGEHGARVRSSLSARADALRFRQMTEIEAAAHSSTERMGLPMVMLFIGFLVLIGYPAITHVIGGL